MIWNLVITSLLIRRSEKFSYIVSDDCIIGGILYILHYRDIGYLTILLLLFNCVLGEESE